MKSPRSYSQMDNFYAALSRGSVKTSGIMNYIQHLYIAQRYPPGGRILDMCCGRGLLLPLLCNYATAPVEYIGVDISSDNLAEANILKSSLESKNPYLKISLIQGDVTNMQSCISGTFDCIVYTSAIEHMPRKCGVASLHQASKLLKPDGVLFLSTPNTPSGFLQYKVHIHEWSDDDLEKTLIKIGFKINDKFGLMPENPQSTESALSAKFGPQVGEFIKRLSAIAPTQFIEPIVAMTIPEASKEIFYVCQHQNNEHR